VVEPIADMVSATVSSPRYLWPGPIKCVGSARNGPAVVLEIVANRSLSGLTENRLGQKTNSIQFIRTGMLLLLVTALDV
jgi:hypothetical protein